MAPNESQPWPVRIRTALAGMPADAWFLAKVGTIRREIITQMFQQYTSTEEQEDALKALRMYEKECKEMMQCGGTR